MHVPWMMPHVWFAPAAMLMNVAFCNAHKPRALLLPWPLLQSPSWPLSSAPQQQKKRKRRGKGKRDLRCGPLLVVVKVTKSCLLDPQQRTCPVTVGKIGR